MEFIKNDDYSLKVVEPQAPKEYIYPLAELENLVAEIDNKIAFLQQEKEKYQLYIKESKKLKIEVRQQPVIVEEEPTEEVTIEEK